jgi:hypothetical protein
MAEAHGWLSFIAENTDCDFEGFEKCQQVDLQDYVDCVESVSCQALCDSKVLVENIPRYLWVAVQPRALMNLITESYDIKTFSDVNQGFKGPAKCGDTCFTECYSDGKLDKKCVNSCYGLCSGDRNGRKLAATKNDRENGRENFGLTVGPTNCGQICFQQCYVNFQMISGCYVPCVQQCFGFGKELESLEDSSDNDEKKLEIKSLAGKLSSKHSGVTI